MTRGYSKPINTFFPFKIGDIVKIISIETRNATFEWTSFMKNSIDSTGIVKSVDYRENNLLIYVNSYQWRLTFPVESCVFVDCESRIINSDIVMEKESIPYYPHICPKCNSSSYNNMFINKVDCSKIGCDGKP